MALALSLLACLWSCASPEAIAPFAESAQKTLAGGPPLFSDIHDSCIRRETARPSAPILPLFVPPGSKDAPPANPPALAPCARFENQAQALTKVSEVLSAYFRAMQQLAAFDASTVTTLNETTADNAATVAGLSLTQTDSVGKLANFITRVFTEGYQRRRLAEYLRNADPEIEDVTLALDRVMKNYLDFLNEEQQTVTARYQTVGDTSQKAVLLLLNRAYSDDIVRIQRRRAAAEAYREALTDIREGHHQLLRSAEHLSARNVSLAIQPYTFKLNNLLPALERSIG